jgi:4'-phosphopantetheinyl transferase
LSDGNLSFQGWLPAPHALEIRPGEVHLWLLQDGALAAAVEHAALLAEDERERAARLGDHRSRSYIGTRATLRLLLSRYTNELPDAIRFSYGPLGKPAFGPGGVHFSISHAGDRALLAFSRSTAIGVDLERVRTTRRFDALTARFFADANARAISIASPSALPRVFAEAWAQREAYVKAVGGGLYATADALPFTPGRIPLQRVKATDGSVWTVASVDAGDEYEAKLVAQGEMGSMSHFTLSLPVR